MSERGAVRVVERRVYSAPKLKVLGTVEKITHGTQNGNFTDATFPAHTPKGQLTFS